MTDKRITYYLEEGKSISLTGPTSQLENINFSEQIKIYDRVGNLQQIIPAGRIILVGVEDLEKEAKKK